MEVRAKANKLVADQFPNKEKPSFLLPSRYHEENDGNTKDKLKDTLVKIKQFKETVNLSNDQFNYLPTNATIRQEYIKCGKTSCNNCPHGPYYYAYFKDKSNNQVKLRKEYLGTIDPRH